MVAQFALGGPDAYAIVAAGGQYAVGRQSQRQHVAFVRTTAEILAWSLGLLHGEEIDDIDGRLDTLAGCRSPLHGHRPTVTGEPSKNDEREVIVNAVQEWLRQTISVEHIGIAARSKAYVDTVIAALGRAGIHAVPLAKDAAPRDAVSISTMYRIKGQGRASESLDPLSSQELSVRSNASREFRCMIVAEVSTGQVPWPVAVTPVEDDRVSHDLDMQRERCCLLFVACTRAREELLVTWSGQPSPLLGYEN